MSVRSTAYMSKLEKAGVPAEQERAHAEALEELVMGDYVTKNYLDARLTTLESKLQTQMTSLESKLLGQMMRLEATMIRWIVGQGVAIVALIVALSRLIR